MVPPHPLSGPREKVYRAWEHIEALKDEIRAWIAWFDKQPDVLMVETNRYTEEQFVWLNIPNAAPVVRWGVLVGDALHNLRSALDHLVEQLTIALTGVPLDRTEFPIYADGIDFWKLTGKHRNRPDPSGGLFDIRGISFGAATLIEWLQPYHRTDDPTLHPLQLLYDLSNMDKHRVVPVLAMQAKGVSWSFGAPAGTTTLHIQHLNTSNLRQTFPLEHGTVIGRFKTGGVQVQLELPPVVILEDGARKGDLAQHVLTELLLVVDCIVERCSMAFPR